MIPAAACAQDYPTRAVRIIVPFPAGGTADLMPRIVATGCRANGSRP
jgi:tripartite-type tricarboxylate transporter receptor subunit TctC